MNRSSSWLAACLLAALLAAPRAARADPITPWPGEQTPLGSLQLVPLVYVSGDGRYTWPSLYASAGIGTSWDVYVGLWGYAGAEGAGFDLLDVFPRFHVGEETALALRLMLTPQEGYILGGELHTNLSWGDVSLMLNAGVRPDFEWGTGRLRSGTVFAMLAPEYHFSNRFSVYFELNPVVGAIDPFSRGRELTTELSLLPGICFSLDEEQNHQFSVGAELVLRRGEPVSLANSVSFAAWYATSFELFGGDEEEPEASARSAARTGSRRLAQRGATAWNR
ncbi:hypothetical protein [Archangium primigenium]|uniref:hypothetical protein n=1 Tax=[Archangium] primigenium TaxID=2792470 RepID=UPI001956B5C7|nr:hypothetical protein [Archangium primigenium]MBM7119056.1 hypothetical protein [Archangium primigenium]